jgi:amino acid transporter/nucleotide-binding universal stress UspA family protein
MLTFISYWRAAAIVLNDLGSSAFYACGIAEQAVGKSAAWFIVGVMLFSFTVRAVYVESCSMFVRGGVYRVVKEALGGTLAKISVSALMFDYILTGPISGVSAGQYIAGLLNDTAVTMDTHGWIPRAVHNIFGGTPHFNVNWISVVVALAVTAYFWHENIKGIHESSEKALRVMQIVTVMVVILLGWSAFTLVKSGYQPVPLPFPENLHFSKESLGFLKNSFPEQSLSRMFGVLGILMAFGHSVLAMSGEESLAQVNRELAHPKLKNLKKAAIVIAIYSFVFTGLTALLSVMLIPDAVRVPVYKDNLIAGLAMNLYGPLILRLLFRAFVVVVGFLILSGAVNTAIIGSNGVLNRVSEDGVLADWFRFPHRKYGTSSRIINMVVGLQVLTILASRGDVYVLGEAYAFGVIWSFTFNSLAMLVLRFKYHGERGWKVPPNITIRGREIPIGLASVFLVLLSTALVNLFTKSVATVAGVSFAVVFFVVFSVSERVNNRKSALAQKTMKDQFQLLQSDTVERASLNIRRGNVLVPVRDYNTLAHLRWALERIDTREQDVVVMSARVSRFGAAAYDLSMEQIFSDYEQTLFTRAVSVAESVGKHVSLLVVPAGDVWSAIVQTANNLDSSAVVLGVSSKMTPAEQALAMGHSWEGLPEPKRQFVLQIVRPEGKVDSFRIGPHTPTMMNEDVLLLHRLWLNITREPGLENVHHHEILTEALTRFAHDYAARDRQEIIKELRRITGEGGTATPRRTLGPAHAMQEEPSQSGKDDGTPPQILE